MRAATGRVLLPFLAAFAAPVAAQSGPWPTTDWTVDCYAPSEAIWTGGRGSTAALSEYTALIDGMISAGECNMTLEGMPAQDKRKLLREISAWLNSQEFPPPLVGLDTLAKQYEAYLIPAGGSEMRVCYLGECVGGRTVYLFSGRPGSAGPAPVNLMLLQPQPEETAHELFHAVQFAYPNVDLTAANRWLIEGTAEAVELTWRKRSGLKEEPLSTRHYDQTLPRQAAQLESYKDETFWRAVSRQYTGEADYRFLDSLFRRGPSGDGVREAHQAFQRWGGLDDVYTQVIARHLVEDRFYSRVPVLRLSTAGRTRDSAAVKARAIRIAANAHRIVATVPPNSMVGLTIRLAEDHPDLRLVVDSARYDLPVDERNVFRTALPGQPGPFEFFVRVVNVAEDPAATTDRSYELVAILARPEECDGQQLWQAVHPDARSLLMPPEEYQEKHEPDPGLHPVVSQLRFQGLVNDGGVACAHPLGHAPNPTAPPDRDAGERMKRRLTAMSPEEMQALGQRIAKGMQGRQTPDAMLRALETQPIADSVVARGTLIHVFSPNAVYWQRFQREIPDSMDPLAVLGSQPQDGPAVAWSHAGIGGWQANSGAHAMIIVPDAPPARLEEGATYSAVGIMQYSRGEGVQKRSRRNTSPQSSGTWQGLEGWAEQVNPDTGEEPWNFRGTVTIERKTGASFRGTFRLSGEAIYIREECPPNPQNLNSVSARCRAEQRKGEVTITGWFEAPWVKPR